MTRNARILVSLITASIAVAVLSFAGVSAAAERPASPATATTAPPFGHVFVIMGENTALSQLTSKTTPYLIDTLKPSSAWITNDYSFPVDGSLANYIGLTSGQYIPCEVHNLLPDKCHQNVPNVFQQLSSTGRSWRVWAEGATGPCDFIDSGMDWTKNVYSAHHNPAIYYDGIVGGVYDEGVRPRTACIQNDLAAGTTGPNDTSALDAALASGDVGNLNLIVPNDCENGHDPCGTRNPFGQFDSFLQREIPKIEASPAFGTNGVIVVTYDEGADKPFPNRFNIPLAIIGPQVKTGVYGGANHVSHYSVLRAIEDGFGLTRLGGAATAQPLPNVFG
jgi:phosphatidylinositol-3-phosphatase